MPKYYAVARGREVGIFSTWTKCKAQVFKFSNAKFKSFESYSAAKTYLDCQEISWSNGKELAPNIITNYFVKDHRKFIL